MSSAQTLKNSDIIVIKVGTVLLIDLKDDSIRQNWLDALAQDIKSLIGQGKKILVVSSGAVALGRRTMGIARNVPPEAIPLEQKQASSAIGQFHVFHGYYDAFAKLGMAVAQVLLTMSETENRRMHLNARETLRTLMDKGIIPVINENDAISTGEIRFGDNDRLAARVAQMVDADTVVLLSTIDGLYEEDPGKNKNARHIPVVEKIADDHIKMAGEAVPGLSTGGMKSKLQAAIAATRAGIALIISDGMIDHPLKALQDGARSTLFQAQETKANARKLWIQTHMKVKGAVIVDEGAMKALLDGRSLLPVGVKSIEGSFERGDVIGIKSQSGKELGVGLSAYHANDAKRIIGKPSSEITGILGYAGRDELIHRNDMVLNG